MKSNSSLHRLTEAGLIAALYTVLSLILPMASFGAVQMRFSEALTILPVFTKNAVSGLALGCALSNAVGVAMGANVAGAWDVLIGSAATLLAAMTTRALRHVCVKDTPLLSTLPPVLFNAAIIGAELCVVVLGECSWSGWGLMALQVGLGQAVPCVVGGLIVYAALKNGGISTKIFPK